MTHRSNRLPQIDGLRGLAAVGVAWFHLFTQNGGDEARAGVSTAFAVMSVWGRFGVQLFFAISGFVLAYTLYPNGVIERPVDVGKYFLRRSVRLDVVYWFVLLCYLLGQPWLASLAGDSWAAQTQLSSVGELLSNIFYFIPLHNPPRVVVVAWTLGLEVQLYTFFSICMLAAHAVSVRWSVQAARSAAWVVSMAAIIGALWPLGLADGLHVEWSQYMWPHLNNFLLGAAACLIVTRAPSRWIVAALVVAPHALAFARTRDSVVAAALVSFVLLVLACELRWLRAALSHPLSTALGRYSYVIYLSHMLVGAIAIELLQRTFVAPPWMHVVFVGIGVGVTLAFSMLTYRLVERPSIRLSKNVQVGPPRQRATENPEAARENAYEPA